MRLSIGGGSLAGRGRGCVPFLLVPLLAVILLGIRFQAVLDFAWIPPAAPQPEQVGGIPSVPADPEEEDYRSDLGDVPDADAWATGPEPGPPWYRRQGFTGPRHDRPIPDWKAEPEAPPPRSA
jgi:hypothetical protein